MEKFVELFVVGVMRDEILFLVLNVKSKFFCLFVVGGSLCWLNFCGRNFLGVFFIIGILKRYYVIK